MATKDQKIIGAFERVSFPEFNIRSVVAKVDTGAYTGALHCTKIHEEETKKGMVLHFSPFDHPEVVKTTEHFYVKHVKSSNGSREKRYIIDTEIEFNGEKYPIILSLANRSEMKWPVLIGRRFLRTHKLVVDVTRMNK